MDTPTSLKIDQAAIHPYLLDWRHRKPLQSEVPREIEQVPLHLVYADFEATYWVTKSGRCYMAYLNNKSRTGYAKLTLVRHVPDNYTRTHVRIATWLRTFLRYWQLTLDVRKHERACVRLKRKADNERSRAGWRGWAHIIDGTYTPRKRRH